MLIKNELIENRKQIFVLKPLSTLLLIAIGFNSYLASPTQSQFGILILMGLIFCFGGDMALMFPQNKKAFRLGLGLFLTAHIIYATAFLQLGQLSYWDLLSYSFLIFIGASFYRMIHHNLGDMKISVIAYIIIITIMVGSAGSVWWTYQSNPNHAAMIFSGALLFYSSDLILAANRFWNPWKYNRLSLAFYYCGQLLIALSLKF